MRAGDLSEDRSIGQSGATGVVEIEDAADHFARRVEPRNRLELGVEDLRIGVDPQPAEGERDAAGDLVRLERRSSSVLAQLVLLHRETAGARGRP